MIYIFPHGQTIFNQRNDQIGIAILKDLSSSEWEARESETADRKNRRKDIKIHSSQFCVLSCHVLPGGWPWVPDLFLAPKLSTSPAALR